MKNFLLFTVLFIFAISLSAQCHDPQLAEDRLAACSLVITGKVLSSEGFYNEFGQIDTRHRLEVFETWFGDTNVTQVDMITHGGVINEEATIVTPSLKIQEDDLGVFLLRNDGVPVDFSSEQVLVMRPVAAHESVMIVDTLMGVAYDQDRTYETLDSLYTFLSGYFERGPRIVREVVRTRELSLAVGRSVASISSFSPATLSAGTGQVLTINGSGFGSDGGTVFFDSPDDGIGGSLVGAPEAAIQSWSNTQIRVNVFGRAGTGRIQVRAANGMTATSSQVLTVTYAITQLQTSNGQFITARMVDDAADGDGGYDYLFSNSGANGGQSFAGNAQAVASFRRALNEWQGEAGYAIYAGMDCGTTSVQLPINGDGINIVSFGSDAYDFDNRHGNGTVGVAFSYYSACGSSQFEMIGNDIMFRRNGNPNGVGGSVNYNFGTGPDGSNQTNFESVALHEIGHTHQLNHVASNNQVMNFRVLRPALRELSANDLTAADFVSDLAIAYNPPIVNCGNGNEFNRQRDYTLYDAGEDCAAAVLPVTLLTFDGRAVERTVNLNWTTSNETNNDFFEVQRSADGRTFNYIGRVAGNGTVTTEQRYTFSDIRPLSGTSYYRLAQVDFDGSTNLTTVIRVDFNNRGIAPTEFFPNPVTNQLNVVFDAKSIERRMIVIDARGRVINRIQVPAELDRIPVQVSNLPTGVYFLQLGDDTPRRFVKK